MPADWADATDEAPASVLSDAEKTAIAKQVKELMEPIARMDGDSLPVSAFKECADGQFELGASAYEKRGVAVMVPHWDETKCIQCIQCNQCAYVCPHATIRPFALNEAEVAEAPETMRMLDVKIPKDTGYKFAIAVSPLDCMGCTNCAKVCPKDALTMVPAEGELVEQKTFDYCVANVAEKTELVGNNVKASQFNKVCPKDALTMVPAEGELVEQKTFDYCVANVAEKTELVGNNVKASQFKQPLLEFSGSCAGCAETAYARLVTQVCGDRMFISNATGCSSIWGNPAATSPFCTDGSCAGCAETAYARLVTQVCGDRMFISNATGCSSIWGNPAATSPFCTDANGHGPAWNNSLFEDNAEHGLGLELGYKAVQGKLVAQTEELMVSDCATDELTAAAQAWIDARDDVEASTTAAAAYLEQLEACGCDKAKAILAEPTCARTPPSARSR